MVISIGTEFLQLPECKPVNKALCVCKWSPHSHCLGMANSMALESKGSWYVLHAAAAVGRLVYHLPVLKLIKTEVIMRPKP